MAPASAAAAAEPIHQPNLANIGSRSELYNIQDGPAPTTLANGTELHAQKRALCEDLSVSEPAPLHEPSSADEAVAPAALLGKALDGICLVDNSSAMPSSVKQQQQQPDEGIAEASGTNHKDRLPQGSILGPAGQSGLGPSRANSKWRPKEDSSTTQKKPPARESIVKDIGSLGPRGVIRVSAGNATLLPAVTEKASPPSGSEALVEESPSACAGVARQRLLALALVDSNRQKAWGSTREGAQFNAMLKDLFVAMAPTSEDARQREYLVCRVQEAIRKSRHSRSARIIPFGSFETDVYTKWGDMDLCMLLNRNLGRGDVNKILNSALDALVSQGTAFGHLRVLHARVPLVIFADVQTRIACDLSVGNVGGVTKSRALRWLLSLDSRCRPLILLVKLWAKANKINDPKNGTLNSYALSLLVIFHLQTCCPPILPPLSQVLGSLTDSGGAVPETEDDVGREALMQPFHERVEELRRSRQYGGAPENPFNPVFESDNRGRSDSQHQRNVLSVAALFASFFTKYAAVGDLWERGLAVRPYTGQWGDFTSGDLHDWSSSNKMIVEDPFDFAENCARSVREGNLRSIVEAFERTAQRLCHPPPVGSIPELRSSLFLWPEGRAVPQHVEEEQAQIQMWFQEWEQAQAEQKARKEARERRKGQQQKQNVGGSPFQPPAQAVQWQMQPQDALTAHWRQVQLQQGQQWQQQHQHAAAPPFAFGARLLPSPWPCQQPPMPGMLPLGAPLGPATTQHPQVRVVGVVGPQAQPSHWTKPSQGVSGNGSEQSPALGVRGAQQPVGKNAPGRPASAGPHPARAQSGGRGPLALAGAAQGAGGVPARPGTVGGKGQEPAGGQRRQQRRKKVEQQRRADTEAKGYDELVMKVGVPQQNV